MNECQFAGQHKEAQKRSSTVCEDEGGKSGGGGAGKEEMAGNDCTVAHVSLRWSDKNFHLCNGDDGDGGGMHQDGGGGGGAVRECEAHGDPWPLDQAEGGGEPEEKELQVTVHAHLAARYSRCGNADGGGEPIWHGRHLTAACQDQEPNEHDEL